MVTTRRGIDARVSVHEVALYVKVGEFLHRHLQYEATGRQITRGLGSDRERVLAVFEWTRQNIRPTPPEWPAVDDHVWHIIVRGHGHADQMADVFTTLSTYVGIPAFWRSLIPPDSGHKLVVSFARVEGRWAMFDVANNLIFRNGRGDLASVEEIAADRGLLARTAGDLRYVGIPYTEYFAAFAPPSVPPVLRAEKQMPWPRLVFEATDLGRRTAAILFRGAATMGADDVH